MPHQLTVIIPCKNERHNIGPCIEAVRELADEVLVADSGSTDGTMEIATALGARLIEREYVHSGDFKNWAIPQAAHQWVLIVDADERITPALAEEIRETLADPPQDGYWINRENYYMGHLVRYSGWSSDCCLRLFHRDRGRYVGNTDHAEVEISTGRVGRLKHRMQHFGVRSYEQYMPKFLRYTRLQAELWYRQGRRASLFHLLTRAPLRFFQTYVLRWGFLDGMAGVQVCMLAAFSSFLKQARLWELHHAEKFGDAGAASHEFLVPEEAALRWSKLECGEETNTRADAA
ncbi:MAG: glycosyltransferase family 2 protein [Pirellulaceae bacterium]